MYTQQNYNNYLNIHTQNFEEKALELFRHQAAHCKVYKDFLFYLGINSHKVHYPEHIPFLPIECFKKFDVVTQKTPPQMVFTSSGTTNAHATSRHLVADLGLYRASFFKAFAYFYGDIKNYCVLGLLPAYLERTPHNVSSLVYMTQALITQSGHEKSGFYLYNYDELQQNIVDLQEEMRYQNKKILLLGVTFALLDMAQNFWADIVDENTVIMETGGMKGRGKELIRAELHQILCTKLGVRRIHSEYGMTELLSQAYSKGNGVFYCPPQLKIYIRDAENPIYTYAQGRAVRGGINAIDFANVHSCAFVATQDLGKINTNGSFEVLGRFDYSDVRGCNLLLA
jgi:hypothetical protein